MGNIQTTGFWINPDKTQLCWIRNYRSRKRDELWSLSLESSECGPVFVWTDKSGEIRREGASVYCSRLREAGWVITQRPNGCQASRGAEMPRIPAPSLMLDGKSGTVFASVQGVWEYAPGETVSEYETLTWREPTWRAYAGEFEPDDYRDVDDTRIPGRGDDFFSISDLVDIAKHDPADDVDTAESPEPVADYVKPDSREVSSRSASSRQTEPKPDTQEIPEVPPAANTNAVTYATLPSLMRARDLPEFAGLGFIRYFRTAAGRKAAYVAARDGKCVIAYRDRYKRGSDAAMESKVRDYVASLGYEIAAPRPEIDKAA